MLVELEPGQDPDPGGDAEIPGKLRRDLPPPCLATRAASENGLAVGAEGHGGDLRMMLERFAERPARGEIPQPRSLVLARGCDGLAIGRKRHGEYLASMLGERADIDPGGVPELRRLVWRCR